MLHKYFEKENKMFQGKPKQNIVQKQRFKIQCQNITTQHAKTINDNLSKI